MSERRGDLNKMPRSRNLGRRELQLERWRGWPAGTVAGVAPMGIRGTVFRSKPKLPRGTRGQSIVARHLALLPEAAALAIALRATAFGSIKP